MGSFKLAGLSLKGLFGKPATRLYPIEKPTYFERTVGHIENHDIDACILCGICARRCPTGAITVDRRETRTWTIDPFHCIGCNSCVRACPKGCLVDLPDYTRPARTKTSVTLVKPPEEEADRPGKAVEPAAG